MTSNILISNQFSKIINIQQLASIDDIKYNIRSCNVTNSLHACKLTFPFSTRIKKRLTRLSKLH